MPGKKYMGKTAIVCALFFISIFFYSCSPEIKFFDVSNRTITSQDSVILTWDVSGKPRLLFHEEPATDSAGIKPIDATAKFLIYTLVVKKGDKEKSQTIQVVMLPNESADLITFRSELSANGDTIIAIGEKNPKRWGHLFEILTVASDPGTSLNVRHSGITADLDQTGVPAMAFKGTPVEGHWEFRHVLTASEKSNLPQSLEMLRIHTTIQYNKR